MSDERAIRREHINKLLRARLDAPGRENRTPRIEPAQLAESPLSPGQERMWLFMQMFPDSLAYQNSAHLQISGDLSIDMLEHALDKLVDRQQILRVRFYSDQTLPSQSVSLAADTKLVVTDISTLEPHSRERQVAHLADRHSKQKPEIGQLALLRFHLVKLAPTEHVLLFTLSHTLFDGWSVGVFKRDLLELYYACVNKVEPCLPELPVSYLDYANWHRHRHESEEYERQIDYWRATLGGVTQELALPCKESSPQRSSGEGRIEQVLLSIDASRNFQKFCSDNKVTPYMVLVAACAVLMFHYGNREEVTLGCPTVGRSSKLENLIGCFMNMVALRLPLSPDLSLLRLLTQVRETLLNALEHKDVSFHHVVQAINPKRPPGRPPFFQALVQYINFPPLESGRNPLEIRRYKTDYDVAPIDLAFEWGYEGDRLCCSTVYDVDLFEAPAVRNLTDQYVIVLEQMFVDVNQPIASLTPVVRGERDTLLRRWNDTQKNFPDTTLPELIGGHAQKHPDETALELGQSIWTYRQLYERSLKYSSWLHELQLAPNDRVVLALSRCPETIAIILGVMHTGAAYVFLDLSHPVAHNRHILADVQPRLILTETSSMADALFANTDEQVVLDRSKVDAVNTRANTPARGPDPKGVAYIMYTSGSTGLPKGVPILHESLSNYVHGLSEVSGIESQDRHLQFSSLSSDFSIEEIFVTLANRAALILRTQDMIDPDVFLDRIECMRISIVSLPTSFFSVLTARLASRALPACVRAVLIGGEAVKAAHLKLWNEAVGDSVKLINTYGPTEAAVVSTAVELKRHMLPIPIGKPLANYRHYVLDPMGYLAPIGVAGELYIGGIGLSPGYWNLPEESELKFVAATDLPDVPDAEGRLFRTGDRVRYATDGNLIFLGRLDRQIKHKGFRVELEAIANVVRAHPDVIDAFADVLPDSDRLVVWYQANESLNDATKNLSVHLARRLPVYMIPNQWVQVDEWPLTYAGKISADDLRSNVPNLEQHYESPITDTERWVAEIWQGVMQIDKAGRQDAFIELGGDSIQAMQILNRIRKRTQNDLPLAVLFETDTLEEFCLLLDAW